MNVYIVEDEIFQLEDILISLETLGHNTIGHNDDPFDALQQIQALKPDVILMDIHLHGKLAGVSLAKQIHKNLNIPIIFITSDTDKDVILEAAEVNPISYLSKPVNEDDLRAALLLAEAKSDLNIKQEVTTENNELFIRNGNKLIKVLIPSILFIHTDTKNYCNIVTKEGKNLSVRNSILGLQKLLDDDILIQTHRSYIINWKEVDFFHDVDQTVDVKGHTIPVGRTFKQELYAKLNII